MKKMMSSYVLVIALAAGVATTALVAQQSQPKSGAEQKSGHSGTMTGNMDDQCKQMMSMHNKVMADMKAMDATLDQKVAAMNAAKGNAKVDAMAAVINEIVSQRKQMMSRMSGMRDQMMAHMGEHMAQSSDSAMRRSVAQCPMMKGAGQ